MFVTVKFVCNNYYFLPTDVSTFGVHYKPKQAEKQSSETKNITLRITTAIDMHQQSHGDIVTSRLKHFLM